MNKITGEILILCLLSFIYGCSQLNTEDLDEYFTKSMERAGFVGLQAAYIKDGELQWSGSYGVKDLNTQEAVNDSTLFMIASCSKPVTALAIMKLFDQNLIGLDDDINQYLTRPITNPNHPDKIITIRMLLTHTSSLIDNWDVMIPLYTLDIGGGDSPVALPDLCYNYFLPGGKFYDKDKNFSVDQPGQNRSYCNMGYALLGYLIEIISNKGFTEYMQTEIFEPLNMNNSYWLLSDIPHKNVSNPHEWPEEDAEMQTPKVLPHYGYPDYPDGQLRTTVEDYAQILKLMINEGEVDGKPFIRKETVIDMLRIQFPDSDKWQAIAWNYNEFDHWLYYILNPRLPAHTGVDPGVATVTCFNPDKKTGAIIFLNNTPPRSFGNMKLFYMDMVNTLLKKGINNN